MFVFPAETQAPSTGELDRSHIAGSASALDPVQRMLVTRAAEVGREHLAPRAAQTDRSAVFPRANFDALHAAGLLGIAVPERAGGLGADFAGVALVCAELGRHCGSTALCYTMHASVGLLIGPIAEALVEGLGGDERADQARRSALHQRRMAEHGRRYAQAFSEAGAAAAGQAPWATRARKVEGGYRIDGEKVFASMAGAADHYAVLCTLDPPGRPGGGSLADAIVLAVPAGAAGLEVCGEWDPLGMRGTSSRTLRFDGVTVADDECLLPAGLAHHATRRYPHLHSLLSAPYMGIAQAAVDFTVHYLRADLPGMAPVKRRMYPTKQLAVAEMRMRLEQTRALFLLSAREAAADPDHDARMRLYAAHCSVTENAHALCAHAVRTCGGQATLKTQPLERLYRDARCGSLMLPWTAEICLDHLGRESLYEDGERADAGG